MLSKSDMGWIKYSYVCTVCDAYIEITTLHNLEKENVVCSCRSKKTILIGYADANVRQRMHVTDITPEELARYLPNTL